MINITQFFDDLVPPGLGATGIGGDPLYRFIERDYTLLCEKKQEVSLDKLVDKVTQKLSLYRENKDNPHFLCGRMENDYLYELDNIEKSLQDFCSVVTCPIEEVTMYQKSLLAAKIARRRLADAK